MTIAVMTPENQMSHSLPPAEAWLEPHKWINVETGQVLPGINRIILPVDDRNFVIPDKSIKVILANFKPAYRWGYDRNNPQTKPNEHHYYHTESEYLPIANGGSFVPKIFRGLPSNIGYMPWRLHNVFHAIGQKPEMPSLQDMKEYIEAYDIVHGAFRNLFDKAKSTVFASGEFPRRARTLANGTGPKGGGEDIIGQAYMRSSFRDSFKAYSEAREIYQWTPHKEIVDPNYRNLDSAKPNEVVRRLGRIVTRNSINYLPIVTGRAA